MHLIRFFLIVPVFLFFMEVTAQSYVPQLHDPRFAVGNLHPLKAYAFPLDEVKLLPGSPFYHAMKKDEAYLLLLKPDRLLNRFHKNAGLPVKDSVYKGWESEGLSGHTLGHYLSAASMMYVSDGNLELLNNVNYIVNEIALCQQARKTGYVGGIPNEDSIFAKVARGEIKSSGFDLNGGWSPWYTVHKLMAGLLDAYLYAGNQKAFTVAKGMADWTYNTISHLPDSLRQKMLRCEYGGMNDVLANIYAISGDKKYLTLSYMFYDDFVMKPLSMGIDPMSGKHSNTNVPKAIGSARQFQLTGNKGDSTIAVFFWNTMVNHHSYVIGGNSNYEYCGEPGKLSERLSDNTCETCNTYNMLKLTRQIFSWSPSSVLMDYYERALYNHILASQNPENGMMCYFVPLRMGTKKQFSDSFNTFTCCVGSGVENHSKYAEQIYSHDAGNTLFVNLFIPSALNWKEKGIMLRQETTFPDNNNTTLTFQQAKAARLDIRIRKPSWNVVMPLVFVNGKKIMAEADGTGYYTIAGVFKKGDSIRVEFDMQVYAESMPDNPGRIAFKYGPLVLAGLLGKEMPDPVFGTPVLMTNDRTPSQWIKQVSNSRPEFKMKGIGKPFDVTLVPFYTVYDQYYSVYWDYFTQDEWTLRQKEYEEEKKRIRDIEAGTIDVFRIGEMQPERDHQLKASERSYVDEAIGRMGREARAGNYFSFTMTCDPSLKNVLMLTYIGDDKDRKFDVFVDGVKQATVEWNGGKTGKFYDFLYDIPKELTSNKKTITIRIEANYGKTAGRIFGVRILKGKL